MKRKVKITDNITGKVIEKEVVIRNLDHFLIQKNTRAQIFTSKKGKGSYKRNKKVEEY